MLLSSLSGAPADRGSSVLLYASDQPRIEWPTEPFLSAHFADWDANEAGTHRSRSGANLHALAHRLRDRSQCVQVKQSSCETKD
jgi:hypothetical protein